MVNREEIGWSLTALTSLFPRCKAIAALEPEAYSLNCLSELTFDEWKVVKVENAKYFWGADQPYEGLNIRVKNVLWVVLYLPTED